MSASLFKKSSKISINLTLVCISQFLFSLGWSINCDLLVLTAFCFPLSSPCLSEVYLHSSVCFSSLSTDFKLKQQDYMNTTDFSCLKMDDMFWAGEKEWEIEKKQICGFDYLFFWFLVWNTSKETYREEWEWRKKEILTSVPEADSDTDLFSFAKKQL